ncbi:MAG: M23 family metallopeptidase [Candidatus Adiutrix sp.]
MHKSNKIRICIMPDSGGTVRTLHLRSWLIPTLALGFVAVLFALTFFAYYSKEALSTYANRFSEMESLRTTNASQEAQINAFADRVAALDRQIAALSSHEDDLQVLMNELNKQLGLDDKTPLANLLPHLNATVDWAYNNKNGVGGAEQLASVLSVNAIGGNSREIIKGMHRDLDRLIMDADDAEHYITALKDGLLGVSSILAATPTVLPLNRRLSSSFGNRRSPFGGGNRETHRGLDIPAPMGTLVSAPADGTILSAAQAGGYGLTLTIDHGYGLITRYAHLSAVLVEPGKDVKRGEKIAKVGNSGRSTGPHLHYETILGGVPVDPLKMLAANAAKKVVISEVEVAMDEH